MMGRFRPSPLFEDCRGYSNPLPCSARHDGFGRRPWDDGFGGRTEF
jgi:hypothetical protein